MNNDSNRAQSSICEDCALRLFNDKCHNLEGIGNPWSGKLIVIPNVDYDAYKNNSLVYGEQVKIIQSILSTGVLDDVYILPLIRCNLNCNCELNDNIIKRCFIHMIRDFKVYDFKHIHILGDAARIFFGIDSISFYLDNVIVSENKKCYTVNYNPSVKHLDDTLFDTFQRKLINWITCANDGNYKGYNMIKL